MPTHIAEIELTLPLPHLEMPTGITRALVLVRQGGRPAGLLRLNQTEQRVSPEQLKRLIVAQGLSLDARASRQIPEGPVAPVSIAVCTHERHADLERCLTALLPLAAAGHEVLVIDNAPRSPKTAEIVARYPFRYLCEPRIGLNHARNRALRAATHSIVAFTDDDAVPDASWISALTQPFSEAKVGCVTGLVLPLELETRAQELFELYCVQRRTFERAVFATPQLPSSCAGVVGMGANMALRREPALRLGGFDPRLDAGTATHSGGDTDMFARILDNSAEIVYTPDALVWHRHRRSEAELKRCIFGYGVGLYSFLTKRLIEHRDVYALITAARWLAGPLVKAARRRIQGQVAVPLPLLLAEASGAFLGPFRFLQEAKPYSSKLDKLTLTQKPVLNGSEDGGILINGNQDTLS